MWEVLEMETRRFITGILIGLVVLEFFLLVILGYSRIVCCRAIFYWADGQSVLVNGSFEDPTGVFRPNVSGGIMKLDVGSTTIQGWTVVGTGDQNVAWGPNENTPVPNGATDGRFFLDLTGIPPDKSVNGFFGGVQQTFATAADREYELSFDIMVFNPTLPGPISAVGQIRTAPGESPYAMVPCGPFNPTGAGNQKMTCTGRFPTNKATSITLTIVGIAGINTQYIGLDNVSVQCVSLLGSTGFCRP